MSNARRGRSPVLTCAQLGFAAQSVGGHGQLRSRAPFELRTRRALGGAGPTEPRWGRQRRRRRWVLTGGDACVCTLCVRYGVGLCGKSRGRLLRNSRSGGCRVKRSQPRVNEAASIERGNLGRTRRFRCLGRTGLVGRSRPRLRVAVQRGGGRGARGVGRKRRSEKCGGWCVWVRARGLRGASRARDGQLRRQWQ